MIVKPQANGKSPYVYPPKLLEGCVLSVDMQDTGIKLMDYSGQNNHGISNGGSLPVAAPYGMARSFDGVDDYIDLGNPSSLNMTAFSILVWAKQSSLLTLKGLVSKYMITSQPSFFLRMSGSNAGKIELGVGDLVANLLETTGSVAANQWFQVVGTFESGTISLYINGKLDSRKTGAALAANNASIRIGSDFSSRYFNGSIGSVKIFNRGLSLANVSREFQNEAWKYGVPY